MYLKRERNTMKEYTVKNCKAIRTASLSLRDRGIKSFIAKIELSDDTLTIKGLSNDFCHNVTYALKSGNVVVFDKYDRKIVKIAFKLDSKLLMRLFLESDIKRP